MEKLFRLIITAVASVAILAGLSACEPFDPIEKDDFIGTRWAASDDIASYSLAFKENYVELRTDVKAGGWYVISGDYDYYPDTKKLVIVFNELKEEHNISVQFDGHVLGGGQLSDSKNSFDYQDSRAMHVTFSKSN